MSIKLSAVICTFNRVDHVQLAIESLTSQTLPADDFEIIVVDNASSDATPDVIGQLLASIANLRYVREETMGLSHARNRGIAESRGEIIVFLDDDAVAEPDCLAAHLRAFAQQPAPVATAGRIYLRWPAERPSWVPVSQESYYSGLDLGDSYQLLTFPQYPYGANMAIDRQTLIDLGGFSVELGRIGTNLISGEEKDLFLRIHRLGRRVVYVPDAVVHHHVLEERTEKKWLLRRSLAQGRSDIVMDAIAKGPPPLARLTARTSLHWARSGRRLVALVGALVLRRDAAEIMTRAGLSLRWVGAAWEGTLMMVRSRSARQEIEPQSAPARVEGDQGS